MHCTLCTDIVTVYRYVEPAGSVAEANAPYRAMRDVERIDFKEDFVTYAKGKGIVPLPTLSHEPYVALYLPPRPDFGAMFLLLIQLFCSWLLMLVL